MTRTNRPATTFIGAGRLTRSLLPAMAAAGYPVLAVASRTVPSARYACRGHAGVRATADPREAVTGAGLVLIATPDREIRNTAMLLAGDGGLDWTGITVLHHSGALGPDELTPLQRRGASTGVIHPLQALGASGSGARLRGSRCRIEGDSAASRIAVRLARDLGLVPLAPGRPLRPSDRAGYHASASLVSNDLVALLAMAVDRMRSAGFETVDSLAGLIALVRGTLANIEESGDLGRSLTGPVSRGDAETLRSQIRTLRGRSRDAAEVHRLLSRRLVELARGGGGLPAGSTARLREVLDRPPGRTPGAGV